MNLWLPVERVGGRGRLGVWDSHVHTLIFKIKCLSMKKKIEQLAEMEKIKKLKIKINKFWQK